MWAHIDIRIVILHSCFLWICRQTNTFEFHFCIRLKPGPKSPACRTRPDLGSLAEELSSRASLAQEDWWVCKVLLKDESLLKAWRGLAVVESDEVSKNLPKNSNSVTYLLWFFIFPKRYQSCPLFVGLDCRNLTLSCLDKYTILPC